MIDVTLSCEDANSKLVDVVTVADEDRVGNNLLQISKLRFGKKILTFVHTVSTRFGQNFEVEFFVEVIKLNLGRDSEAWFGQYF